MTALNTVRQNHMSLETFDLGLQYHSQPILFSCYDKPYNADFYYQTLCILLHCHFISLKSLFLLHVLNRLYTAYFCSVYFYRLAMIGSDIFISVVLKTFSQGASKLHDVLLKMLSFEHLVR